MYLLKALLKVGSQAGLTLPALGSGSICRLLYGCMAAGRSQPRLEGQRAAKASTASPTPGPPATPDSQSRDSRVFLVSADVLSPLS